MKFLGIHPGALTYTKIYLRLEPLGLEGVAQEARSRGHEVRLLDLQVSTHQDFFRLLGEWKPEAIGFSGNYLANIPEIIDLAKEARRCLPESFIFVGGHSASFVAREILRHAEGAVDCVAKGEGEALIGPLLEAASGERTLHSVPGVVTLEGEGPPSRFVEDLDRILPARDLLSRRRKYFIGTLDPCASIEFTRGCPWDCSFCSAWTFYGRSYRGRSPDRIAEELSLIREPGIFIVDDVAFIQEKDGFAIGEAIARRGIRKEYYLETRGDVLLRNKEVFRFWKKLGLQYMFLGIEAIDEEGLLKYRKRTSLGKNFEALEFARSLGITVAINIIADPSWDRKRFEVVRQWCLDIPEIVNISVNTPYPGTETWHSEKRPITSRDYRLFDIQHAVLPTTLPLPQFYEELVKTQQVLNKKHLGWAALKGAAMIALGLLLKGQTNFIKMLWKFNSVFDPRLQIADHRRPVRYEMDPPPALSDGGQPVSLFILKPGGRRLLALDEATEQFVDQSRGGG